MQHSHKAILCFDFDGTFVSRDPDEASMREMMTVLQDLRERGSAWVINTGRSLFQTLEGLTQHSIRQIPDYIIAREGELFHRSQYNRWLDLGDWNTRRTQDHKKLYKSKDKFFREVQKWLAQNTQSKWISEPAEPAGVVSATEEEMDLLCQWLDARLPQHPELSYQRNTIYLRFTHIGYSKGSTLRELASRLHIHPQHILVIGDNHNDLPMMDPEVAQNLACPVNAIPEIQAAVRSHDGFVSRYPATLGCVEALRYYFYD
jgi:HAD superfamily hydrolase (TIGR01484 family)